MPCRQDKAFIVQRGTEEPDALQVWAKSKLGRHGRVRRSLGEGGGHPSLKSDIDLEGCSPLQPWNPIKAQHWAHALSRQDKACIVQRGAEGPDALHFQLMSCPRNKHDFRRRSVGCFSRRERRAYLNRYVRSEQRGKTANWPRPSGLR